jgi:hypothetical protein
MSDPRLNGSHLNVARRDQYDATVDEVLDDRGPVTSDADPLVRRPSIPRTFVRRDSPPPGGTYTLVSLADGKRHPLRVGINTVGRYPENDLVLEPTTSRAGTVSYWYTPPAGARSTTRRPGMASGSTTAAWRGPTSGRATCSNCATRGLWSPGSVKTRSCSSLRRVPRPTAAEGSHQLGKAGLRNRCSTPLSRSWLRPLRFCGCLLRCGRTIGPSGAGRTAMASAAKPAFSNRSQPKV